MVRRPRAASVLGKEEPMNNTTKPRGIFGVTKKNVPGVLIRAMAMYNGFSANAATFSAPTITMVAFLALITALSEAQQSTKETKGKALSTSRNSKRDVLWTAMQSLQSYAQGLSDALSGS